MLKKVKEFLKKSDEDKERDGSEEKRGGPVRVFYPEIKYDGCIKCMICVKLCPNNVFEIKNGYPVVTNPMACDPNCRICGVKCPTRVISFISKIKWE